MALRGCTQAEAIDFAIACGWLAAEKLAGRKEHMAKQPSGKDPNDKAPTTGANKNQDNKATASGKPYPPNRPKAD